MVHLAWSTPISGSPSYVWEQRLKITKKALKEWRKVPIDTPNSQRKESVQQLENLQREMDTIEVTKVELDKE